jgi:hypothetical protein
MVRPVLLALRASEVRKARRVRQVRLHNPAAYLSSPVRLKTSSFRLACSSCGSKPGVGEAVEVSARPVLLSMAALWVLVGAADMLERLLV